MPSDVLPAAVDAQSPLSPAELGVLRSHVKSDNKVEVGEGVTLLMDIYRTEPTRRRECLYFLAVGHYKLGNYQEAKRYNSLLLEKEPTNIQAQSLNSLIDGAVAKEGYVGLALAGGAATVAGLVLTALLSGRSRR
ncbi:hypothetical protein BCR35DRAFT_92777 [Leucosporidium creatinivorum]|uniref:Mitochondrial fission 1 protein n=1 Tax=Leucosporidium creatinivorum TaxID=106004 RepID=A0A1Y2F9Z4_9BASI|nr:hypothetical protein BCR35DRAFT_92777 [Leucosporidium creatinivorum]